VLGSSPRGDADLLSRLGFVAQNAPLYDRVSVGDHLRFGEQMNPNWDGESVRERLVDLAIGLHQRTGQLSGGQRAQVALGLAMGKRPELLLLDEPASGLDPRARIEMRELLKELQRRQKTILISSHILPELADLCNKVGIIEQGELLYSGPVTDIVRQAKTGTILHVSVAENSDLAAALLSQNPGVADVRSTNSHMEVSLKDGITDFNFIPQTLIGAGYRLTMLKEEEVNLETAFMRLTKGMVQ